MKKKKYRPRIVLADPVGYVLEGMSTLASVEGGAQLRRLKLRNYAALGAIRAGEGNLSHATSLISVADVSEAMLSATQLGQGFESSISAGRAAINSMTQRGERTERYLFTGLELTAATELMEVLDAQLDRCTVSELGLALTALRKRGGYRPRAAP